MRKAPDTRPDADLLRVTGRVLCDLCNGYGSWKIYRGPKAGADAVCSRCGGTGHLPAPEVADGRI